MIVQPKTGSFVNVFHALTVCSFYNIVCITLVCIMMFFLFNLCTAKSRESLCSHWFLVVDPRWLLYTVTGFCYGIRFGCSYIVIYNRYGCTFHFVLIQYHQQLQYIIDPLLDCSTVCRYVLYITLFHVSPSPNKGFSFCVFIQISSNNYSLTVFHIPI